MKIIFLMLVVFVVLFFLIQPTERYVPIIGVLIGASLWFIYRRFCRDNPNLLQSQTTVTEDQATKKQALILDDMAMGELLLKIEQSLISRREETMKQINRSFLITVGAITLALAVPLGTWFVTLNSISNKDDGGNLAIFAFSSIPMAGVFVMVSVTMLRRGRALEEKLERVEDQLFEFRKLRAIAHTNTFPVLNAFREVALTKALAGRSLQPHMGKEDDRLGEELNFYSALVNIMNDSRPKKDARKD